ncbi:MAG: HEAT repeat domain-containing protein [Planctomycetota bacterium]|jgi:HEAT repeat protein
MRAFLYLTVSFLFCSLLLPAGTADVKDLDVGVPPGTPLDWLTDQRDPIPTGGRGAVPTGEAKEVREARKQAKAQGKEHKRGMTVTEKPNPPVNSAPSIPNLYDYFGVTTEDIMRHLSPPLGTAGENKAMEGTDRGGPVATGKKATGPGEWRIEFVYPPKTPIEMAWFIIMAALRAQLHPEVVSKLEAGAYLLRMGYPGTSIEGGLRTPGFPKPLPAPPKGKNPKENMLLRLATQELISGFPYGWDPHYAKCTLALGEEMYGVLLRLARSKHSFLAENAVAILANSNTPAAVPELIKLMKTSGDPVIQIRAMTGLIRRRIKSVVPDFIRMAKTGNPVLRAYALYGLGVIGDPKGAGACLASAKLFQTSQDLAWSAIPSLGRIADKSKKTIRELTAIEQSLFKVIGGDDKVKVTKGQGATGVISSEEPGSKNKVLRQMALMALAANGVQKYKDEFLRRMGSGGYRDFHQAVWYIVLDCLVKIDPEGVEHCKRLVNSAGLEQMQAHALRLLASEQKVDAAWVRGECTGGGAMKRALAIQLLAAMDREAAGEVCKSIISGYSGGGDAGEGYVVATAANVGGMLDVDWEGEMLSAAESAYSAGNFARRESNENPDIREFKLSVFPPVAESLIIECGRPQDEEAVSFLTRVLSGDKPGRAEAAFALGNIGGKAAVDALMAALEDENDGWVRYGAYCSLTKISGQSYFCDWIFYKKKSREPYVEAYKDWFGEHPPE